MADQTKYLIRDAAGNVYGPATGEMLRDWVAQGRIVAGMFIAPQATREWVEASKHPEVAHLLGGKPATPAAPATPASLPSPARPAPAAPAPRPTPQTPVSRPAPVTVSPARPTPAAQPTYAPQYPAAPTPAATTNTPVTYAGGPTGPRQNVPAIISLISGIIAIIGSPIMCVPPCACLGGLCGIAALVLGLVSLGQFRATPDQYSGRGMAIAGAIMGGLAILIMLGSIAAFALSLATSHP